MLGALTGCYLIGESPDDERPYRDRGKRELRNKMASLAHPAEVLFQLNSEVSMSKRKNKRATCATQKKITRKEKRRKGKKLHL